MEIANEILKEDFCFSIFITLNLFQYQRLQSVQIFPLDFRLQRYETKLNCKLNFAFFWS